MKSLQTLPLEIIGHIFDFSQNLSFLQVSLKKNNLQNIFIDTISIDDKNVKLFLSFFKNKKIKIKHLKINGFLQQNNKNSKTRIIPILKRCDEKTLTSLNASFADFISHQHVNIQCLQHMTNDELLCISKTTPQLTNIDLSYCFQITDKGLLHLSQHLFHLTSLNLYGCHKITNDELIHLSHLKNLTFLQLHTGCRLHGLYEQKLSEIGFDVLFCGLTKLTHLHLEFTSKDHKELQNIHKLTKLQDLDVFIKTKTNHFIDNEMKHISSLKQLKKLNIFITSDIGHSREHMPKISDEGFQHLFSLKNLERFNLHDNGETMTNKKIQCVSSWKKLTFLSLCLNDSYILNNNTNIIHRDVNEIVSNQELMKLSSLTNLERLFLWGNKQITNDVLLNIIQNMNNLTYYQIFEY